MSKKLAPNTFGNSPAAQQLVDALNFRGSDIMTKNVSRGISATAKQVADLINSYTIGSLSAKTLANCCRLMRDEITLSGKFPYATSIDWKIDRLRMNVQIGHIKRGIRLATVARKAEHVMTDPRKRSCAYHTHDTKYHQETIFSFRDNTTGKVYTAGSYCEYSGDDGEFLLETISEKEVNAGMVEKLVEKSKNRKERKSEENWIEP